MRLLLRWAAVLGVVLPPVLVAMCFARAAAAQGAFHEGHSPSVPPRETLAGLAHSATQGAVVFLAGLAVFAALVWLPAGRAVGIEGEKTGLRALCRPMWALFGLLLVAGMVELPVYAMRASGEALSFGLVAEALFGTRVGWIWVSRVVLGLLVVAVATYATRRRSIAWCWVAVGVAVFLLATLTRQSHAAAEGRLLPFVADWLHVAAASVWMGGLLGFSTLLIWPLRAMPAENRSRLLGRAVRRFSAATTVAVAALLLTGMYATLLHVPSLAALAGTSYGRALIVKLWFVLFLLALGAWNRKLRGREPFGDLVRLELVAAVAVLLATGFLTTLPPADAEIPAEAPAPSLNAPAQPPEGNVEVIVRLSGTPGTSYSGAYGGTTEGTRPVSGVIEAEPADYGVELQDGSFGGVTAAFRKEPPTEGALKLEILADGEVVAERETSEDSGTIAASWSSQDRGASGKDS